MLVPLAEVYEELNPVRRKVVEDEIHDLAKDKKLTKSVTDVFLKIIGDIREHGIDFDTQVFHVWHEIDIYEFRARGGAVGYFSVEEPGTPRIPENGNRSVDRLVTLLHVARTPPRGPDPMATVLDRCRKWFGG